MSQSGKPAAAAVVAAPLRKLWLKHVVLFVILCALQKITYCMCELLAV